LKDIGAATAIAIERFGGPLYRPFRLARSIVQGVEMTPSNREGVFDGNLYRFEATWFGRCYSRQHGQGALDGARAKIHDPVS
jgi:hypothetical protein